jgi:hypothetical protein
VLGRRGFEPRTTDLQSGGSKLGGEVEQKYAPATLNSSDLSFETICSCSQSRDTIPSSFLVDLSKVIPQKNMDSTLFQLL